jgi:polyisoprenoid-binding protein YceI
MYVLPRRAAGSERRAVGAFVHTIMNKRITFQVFTANCDPRAASRPAKYERIATMDLEKVPHPSFVRKALQLAGVFLLAALPLFADSRTYQITPDSKNLVEFHAEDSYDAFDGRTNRVTGVISADPAKPSAASVEVNVDMSALATGNSLRDKEMKELYLETQNHPACSFKSVSVVAPDSIAPNSPADIKVTGDFQLHGTTKRVTIPVRVVLIPDGRIHATSNFKVHMPDFGINVPDNILVTVNNDVPVRLDLWATAK